MPNVTTLYSADRRGFYPQGTLGLWQTDPRPSAQQFLNSHRNDFTSGDIADHIHTLFPEGLSLHGWDHITRFIEYDANGYTRTLKEPAIELVFEYARRAFFPARPCRLQSYFAFDSLEQTLAFANGLPVYKLVASAHFKADWTWLDMSNQMAVASYNAHQYWQGVASAAPVWEYLLVPPVQAIPLP